MGEDLGELVGEDARRGDRLMVGVNGKFLCQEITGTQRYAWELTVRLARRMPGRVVVHVPRGTQVPAALSDCASVRVSRLTGQAFEQLALPWAARRHVLVSLGGPAPILARRLVPTIHDVSVFRFRDTYSRAFGTWYRAMYRALARRSPRLLTVSNFSATEISDVLGVQPDRISVVPNGSDHLEALDARAPHDHASLIDGRFVLCVGTFARHKNLAPVLDAFESAGIRSVVVGARGSAAVFASADADRWGAATFAGRLDDAELKWLYERADALVFPSLYEGFGIPIVEAQRSGCPVIAVAAASIPEVAGDGAVLIEADRPTDAVEAVRRLRDDAALRSELIDRGRANAARYTWDASADGLADLIDAHWPGHESRVVSRPSS